MASSARSDRNKPNLQVMVERHTSDIKAGLSPRPLSAQDQDLLKRETRPTLTWIEKHLEGVAEMTLVHKDETHKDPVTTFDYAVRARETIDHPSLAEMDAFYSKEGYKRIGDTRDFELGDVLIFGRKGPAGTPPVLVYASRVLSTWSLKYETKLTECTHVAQHKKVLFGEAKSKTSTGRKYAGLERVAVYRATTFLKAERRLEELEREHKGKIIMVEESATVRILETKQEIRRVKRELSQTGEELAESEKTHANIEKRIAKLKKEIKEEEEKEERAWLRSRLRERKGQRRDIEENIEEMEERRDNSEAELGKARTQLKEIKKVRKEARTLVEEAVTSNRKLRVELEKQRRGVQPSG